MLISDGEIGGGFPAGDHGEDEVFAMRQAFRHYAGDVNCGQPDDGEPEPGVKVAR
jgi:hypothetical protein